MLENCVGLCPISTDTNRHKSRNLPRIFACHAQVKVPFEDSSPMWHLLGGGGDVHIVFFDFGDLW